MKGINFILFYIYIYELTNIDKILQTIIKKYKTIQPQKLKKMHKINENS